MKCEGTKGAVEDPSGWRGGAARAGGPPRGEGSDEEGGDAQVEGLPWVR
jgi:hypothetical protein